VPALVHRRPLAWTRLGHTSISPVGHQDMLGLSSAVNQSGLIPDRPRACHQISGQFGSIAPRQRALGSWVFSLASALPSGSNPFFPDNSSCWQSYLMGRLRGEIEASAPLPALAGSFPPIWLRRKRSIDKKLSCGPGLVRVVAWRTKTGRPHSHASQLIQ